MTKPKQVNLLANICSSIMSHLSLSLSRNRILSAKFKRRNSYRVFNTFMIVFVFLIMQAGSPLFAQELEIRGKVTSADDGTELIGANVLEKGTTNGTATDVKGEFRLKVKMGAVLVISYVGYSKEEVKVLEQTYLNIALKLEAKQFKEVEVIGIGYGEVKKADATGSVTAISAKDFSKGTITSPQELLIGKAPGVVANSLGGAAGAGTKIRIRGGSSLQANNDPLMVIDNIPLESSGISGMANPLSSINPNDIESITILKDASATAIYGSRASNGVIIIKTKKASLGGEAKMTLNYNGNYSLATPAKLLSVFTGDEFRALIADRVANYGLTSAALSRLGTANTDWQNEIYQTAPTTEHNLSISHSIGSIPYRLSLDYLYQGGILKYNSMDRKNATLSLTPSLLDGNLNMDLNASLSSISNNFSNNDAIGSALEFDPTQRIRNGNTRYGGYTAWTEISTGDPINGLPNNIATHNPVARLEYRHNTSEANRYIIGGKFDYKVPYVPDLKATLNLGYDYYKTIGQDNTNTLASWSYREPERQIIGYQQTKTNSLLDFYLNYKKELGINKIDITGGYSYQHFYNEGVNSSTAAATMVGAKVTPYKNEYFLISFFGRLNYTLLDRYLLTATVRDDGSSRFSKDNRWGLFPAFAFAWKLTEEPFFGKSDVVNELKLRVSWGKTGQQDVGGNYYPYIPTYTASTAGAYYQFGDTFYPTLRPDAYDANLKWETVTSLNGGLDFTILNKRVSGSIEVYKNTSDDLLNNIPIPVGSNFSNFLLTNVGSMENTGVEVGLNVTPILEKDLSWELGVNLTYNKNKITKLTLSDDPAYTGVNTGGISGGVGNNVQKFIVGYPARIFFLFSQVLDANGMPVEGLYVDKSGQGGNLSGNELNKYYYKSPDPDYIAGISSKINYKNFDFSFSGRLSIGNYVYNNNASNRALYQQAYNQSGYLSNILTDVKKTNFMTAQYWSSVYLENGSFFKMDYISLGYNFTSLFGNNLSGRVGLSVQNVFTITKYTGLDPEVDNGIDNNIYPRPRTYMLSISLNY
ncbi:MAG: SusC/RagA family TonB-linked outer membrane protein [Ignavibacteriales bacterium]|nr:MAG: SusC/RagA family TonB-linked outer membrane protein [Ignavibacteriales bacterium]